MCCVIGWGWSALNWPVLQGSTLEVTELRHNNQYDCHTTL